MRLAGSSRRRPASPAAVVAQRCRHHSGTAVAEGSSAEALPALLGRRRPVVLRGYAAGWAATRRWGDPAHLCQRAGGADRLVSVERSDDGHFSHASGRGRTTVPLGLMLEHFAAVVASPDGAPAQVYAAQVPIDELGAALRQDIEVPAATCGSAVDGSGAQPEVNVWLGLGAVTPLHFDDSDNLLVQVCGRKHLRLYDPAESRRLHPFRGTEGPRNASRIVDIAAAEARPGAFPGFVDAQFEETCLAPGDLLYIPRRWWHATRSEQPATVGKGEMEAAILEEQDSSCTNVPYNLSVNIWFDQHARTSTDTRSNNTVSL